MLLALNVLAFCLPAHRAHSSYAGKIDVYLSAQQPIACATSCGKCYGCDLYA